MKSFFWAISVAITFVFAITLSSALASDTKTDIYPDVITLEYIDYFDGIVNHTDGGKYENVIINGRNAVKIVPNPQSTMTDTLSLDGWSYKGAGADMKYYNYVGVEYFYDGKPIETRGVITIQTNGGVLTKPLSANSEETVKSGEWTMALYDISNAEKVLTPDIENHPVCQMHIRPFGMDNLQKLWADSAIYISKVMFFKEKPEFFYVPAYLEGYDDGTFRPSELTTRAEASAIVARIMDRDENIIGKSSFSDVEEGIWYERYIGYLSEKGFFDGLGDKFLPDSPITRGELARLCAMALSLGGENAYQGVGDETITSSEELVTRGQCASFVNTLTGRSFDGEKIKSDVPMLFTDIDETHVFFNDIATACIDHASGSDGWLFPFENPVVSLAEKIGYNIIFNTDAGNAKVAEIDELEEKRKLEIRNTESRIKQSAKGNTYYISRNGDDINDGLSESNPKRTMASVTPKLKYGDTVLFERGSIYREKFTTVEGVSYSAYGVGEKPQIYGSPENGADERKWSLVHEDDETGAKIWQYDQESFTDVGAIVFNDGEGFARKELPSCVGSKFVLRSDKTVEYDFKKELDRDLEFFHACNSKTTSSSAAGEYIDIGNSRGPLYLRCDKGNPGKVFYSIEFNTRGNIISARSNVTIDNLCIMYGGSHGIGAGTVTNLTVTDCELGWIGGSIQGYNANGTTQNHATRFGNGIEVYGSCYGYTIDNCYLYQCYDAGVTHQYSSLTTGNCTMNDVTYSNNVITECVYSIEYFLGTAEGYTRGGDNILFEGNILRRAGFGFGSTRPDGDVQGHVRSSDRDNPFTNYRMINNIFDRSVSNLFTINTGYPECIPQMVGNTYIQGINNKFYRFGMGSTATVNINARKNVKETLKDDEGEFYYVEYIPYYNYTYPKSYIGKSN